MTRVPTRNTHWLIGAGDTDLSRIIHSDAALSGEINSALTHVPFSEAIRLI